MYSTTLLCVYVSQRLKISAAPKFLAPGRNGFKVALFALFRQTTFKAFHPPPKSRLNEQVYVQDGIWGFKFIQKVHGYHHYIFASTCLLKANPVPEAL